MRSTKYELDDTNRRIDNILAAYPRADWSLEESRAMLAALNGIVRVRQGGGDVGLRVSVSLTEASGELADELVVWEISRRPDNLDDAGHLVGLEIPGRDQCLDGALV